jgi:hypothetical protein
MIEVRNMGWACPEDMWASVERDRARIAEERAQYWARMFWKRPSGLSGRLAAKARREATAAREDYERAASAAWFQAECSVWRADAALGALFGLAVRLG